MLRLLITPLLVAAATAALYADLEPVIATNREPIVVADPAPWFVKPGSALKEAAICTEQDEKGEPAGLRYYASSDTGQLGLYFDIAGGPENSRLQLSLLRDGEEVHSRRFRVGSCKRSIWWVEPIRTWTFPEGLYAFELSLNEEILAALEVAVLADPDLDATDVPAPEPAKDETGQTRQVARIPAIPQPPGSGPTGSQGTPPTPPPVPQPPSGGGIRGAPRIPQAGASVAVPTVPRVPGTSPSLQPVGGAEGSSLPQEQLTLVQQAFQEAMQSTGAIGSGATNAVLGELRAGRLAGAGPAQVWRSVPAEAYSAAGGQVSQEASGLAQQALVQMQRELFAQPAGQQNSSLQSALMSGDTKNLVQSMSSLAQQKVTEKLRSTVGKQLGRVAGQGGLLGKVVDVAGKKGLDAVSGFVSGLFGKKARTPLHFLVCKERTTTFIAKRVTSARGCQAALRDWGITPDTAAAAACSDTSAFARGVLIVPVRFQADPKVLGALMVVDSVQVALSEAPLDLEPGYPVSFRGKELRAFLVILQPGPNSAQLCLFGQGNQVVAAGEVEVAPVGMRVGQSFAAIHQVVSQDATGQQAVALCSLTPSLSHSMKRAAVFALTIDRRRG